MTLDSAVYLWFYISNRLKTMPDLSFTKESWGGSGWGLGSCSMKGWAIHQAYKTTAFSVLGLRKYQKYPLDRKPGFPWWVLVGCGLRGYSVLHWSGEGLMRSSQAPKDRMIPLLEGWAAEKNLRVRAIVLWRLQTVSLLQTKPTERSMGWGKR